MPPGACLQHCPQPHVPKSVTLTISCERERVVKPALVSTSRTPIRSSPEKVDCWRRPSLIGSMNSEDMKAYPSEAESTSCIVVRSSAFNSGKSGLLNEETLSLIGSPKYLEDVEAYPSEGFISLNSAGIDVVVHTFL